MNAADLALRKEMLLARSATQRAQLQLEIRALRPQERASDPLVALLSLFAGSGRGASWLGKAAGFLSLARTALSLLRVLRR